MREKTDSARAPAPAKAGLVMMILLLIFFLGTSDNQMISPLLPLIAREFGLESGRVGETIGPAYALAAAVSAFFVGPFSDLFGRRRFLLYASVIFSLSLLAVYLIDSVLTLGVVRLLTGLAAGTFSTCAIAYVGDYFPYERRATAMSIVQAGYFGALVFGVPVATVIAQAFNWRASFAFFGGLSLLAFFCVLFLLPEDRHRLQEGQPAGQRRLYNLRMTFATRSRVASIIAAFCVSCGFVGFLFYLGSYLVSRFQMSPRNVGFVFIAVGVVSLVGAFLAGPLADRAGKQAVSILSTVILAAMVFAIPQFGFGIALFASFLTAALAFAFRQGPLQALATELVPAHARGSLVAMRNMASQLGIAVSTGVSGSLFDRYGYTAVGLFCGTVTLAALIFIAMMKEPTYESGESASLAQESGESGESARQTR